MQKVVKAEVTVNGCGRTDAQVHASQYVFHADLEEGQHEDLVYHLNRTLPDDIAIFAILPVHHNAHARYDAIQRTYDYFIHTSKDPFLKGNSALYYETQLDLQRMKEAVDLLPQYN
ncbi:MAG: tRNA pseudouridine(38-40) synthase TruA, partial [Saprospiraceae bacterium]|nr:tRNA pseudouridine(38-40) synthase TruA [Saprospiraceae bacterium]